MAAKPRTVRRRRGAAPRWAPEPPLALPPGRTVQVPDRGEFFVRDSGGAGPPVMLLHGWMFTADLNFFRTYDPLIEAGFRVLAMDHRGHGRGLRTPAPFRLEDCAADVAGVLRALDVGPTTVVGYSMGGAIAQLMARDHADVLRAIVLSATARAWRDPNMLLLWRGMALLRLGLGLAPDALWRAGLRRAGFPNSATTTWTTSELTRGSARDLAEAGRELGRFDARDWIGRIRIPAAVVVTADDTSVPPRRQRELAAALHAPTFDAPGQHSAVIVRSREYNPVLLEALASVGAADET